MDLATLLLVVAFRHRIKEAEIGAGLARFEAIVGASVDEGEFRARWPAPSPSATSSIRCACRRAHCNATGSWS